MLRGRRGRSVLRSLRLDDEGFVGGSGEVEMLELSERASLWNLFFFFRFWVEGSLEVVYESCLPMMVLEACLCLNAILRGCIE